MKRAAKNNRPFRKDCNAQQTDFVQQRITAAARRLADTKNRSHASIDLAETLIDLLITSYPDCPRWVSRVVDQLMAQNEFISGVN